jgi:hypothetical protein
MAEPQSLSNSQFCSLGSFNYNKVLADDYCHKKFETIKVKGSTPKLSSFNLKISNHFKKPKKSDQPYRLSLTDEYKFGFPYQRYYLQTRVKRGGDVKVHVDGGNIELFKNKLNLFTNVKTTLSFANYMFRVGFNYFGERCESNFRVERNHKGENDFANRTVLTHGKWRYGIVSIVNLDSLLLKKYDSFVEFRNKDLEFHVSHLSPVVHQGLSLGKVTFGGMYRFDGNTNLALQVKKNFSFPKLRAVFGLQKNFSKGTLRAKVDSKLKVSTVGKYKVNPRLTLSAGAQFNSDRKTKVQDLPHWLPVPIGFGVDIEA